MSNSKSDELKHEIDGLEKAMHDADQFRTLEEQVADMKRRGIDPSQAYKDLDRKEEDEDWGQRVVAYIKSIDSKIENSEFRLKLKGNISDYKIPKEFILVSEIPRNEIGKIEYGKLTINKG